MTATAQTTREALNAQLAHSAERDTVKLTEARGAVERAFSRNHGLADHLVYNVVEAEEQVRLWSRVWDAHYGDEVDLVDAVARVSDLEEERLLRGSFANQSSSALSAAVEGVQKETVARWLRDLLVVMARGEAN